MNKLFVIAAASFVALAACEKGGETETIVATPTPAATETAAVESAPTVAMIEASGIVSSKDVVSEPTEDGGAVISGGSAELSPGGQTAGARIMTSNEFEIAASGNTIEISFTAQAMDAESATLLAAYSTNEVGNSGWESFEVGADPSSFSMTYAVPKIVNGRGDFLGFQTVENKKIKISDLTIKVAE